MTEEADQTSEAPPLEFPANVAAVPSLFSTQVHVGMSGSFVRMTFGETFPGAGDMYRAAIVLPLDTAAGLVRLLVNQLAEQGHAVEVLRPVQQAQSDAE